MDNDKPYYRSPDHTEATNVKGDKITRSIDPFSQQQLASTIEEVLAVAWGLHKATQHATLQDEVIRDRFLDMCKEATEANP